MSARRKNPGESSETFYKRTGKIKVLKWFDLHNTKNSTYFELLLANSYASTCELTSLIENLHGSFGDYLLRN